MKTIELLEAAFVHDMGLFWAAWAGIELDTCYAVGKALNIPHEETHLVTAGMEFGRKATLLRHLLARGSDPQKGKMIKAINTLQNESKRNVFAHAFMIVYQGNVGFLERSRGGKLEAFQHMFSHKEFHDHVKKIISAAGDFRDALGVSEDDRSDFANVALNMSAS